jgi:hypothetical protein
MSGSILDETLFAGSTVRLFGHKFEGLRLVTEDEPASAASAEEPSAAGQKRLRGAPPVLRAMEEQLKRRNGGTGLEPGLARIYGFSYLGAYYKLAEPTVLLVYGAGEPVPPTTQEAALGLVGIEFKGETFAGQVRVWAQDRADYTVRIDITPGWLADVLVDPGMSDGTNMTTGRGPDSGGRGPLTGRAQMVGRAQLIGRGNSS